MNNPSPLSRLPTVILLLIVAVGIPGAAAMAFSEQITQNPWRALALALTYEVLVVIGGMLGQVWQRLQSRWVDRLAEKVDGFVVGLGPGYRTRYLEHLSYTVTATSM